MERQAAVVLYVLAMVAVVVGVGRPVLQAPFLAAADRKRRNCPGVRGVLFEVPEASMSAWRRNAGHRASQRTQINGRRAANAVTSQTQAGFPSGRDGQAPGEIVSSIRRCRCRSAV